jgi:hypothetical protein
VSVAVRPQGVADLLASRRRERWELISTRVGCTLARIELNDATIKAGVGFGGGRKQSKREQTETHGKGHSIGLCQDEIVSKFSTQAQHS